jgi:hypothetical protein
VIERFERSSSFVFQFRNSTQVPSKIVGRQAAPTETSLLFKPFLMGSRDDDDDGNPLGFGMGSMLKMMGSNVPARARFVGEAFVSATLYSVSMGLCCGVVGAAVFPVSCGPVVPFLAGSSVGYSFGLWDHFSRVKRNMQWYAHHYPTLLAHALWLDYKVKVPRSVMQASQEQLLREEEEDGDGSIFSGTESIPPKSDGNPIPLDQWVLHGGMGRLTWSMLSAQQCTYDVDAIERQKRQKVVDSIIEGIQAGGSDKEE